MRSDTRIYTVVKLAPNLILSVLLISNIVIMMDPRAVTCRLPPGPLEFMPRQSQTPKSAINRKDQPAQVFDCISGVQYRDTGPSRKDLIPFDSTATLSGSTESPGHRVRQFVDTFKGRAWGRHDPNYKGVQASGEGSTLKNAQRMIAMLQLVVERIKNELGKDRVRILDAPCGDMAWMKQFLQMRPDILYTGVDIVPDLIQIHKKTFQGVENRDFFVHDVAKSPLNFTKEPFDLILSRHCLQHLTIKDAMRALRHFESTGSRYLLTTTWAYARLNRPFTKDFETPGRFHDLNLEIPPYKLAPPLCISLDGPHLSFIGLWHFPLKQIANCHESGLKEDRLFTGQTQPMVHC